MRQQGTRWEHFRRGNAAFTQIVALHRVRLLTLHRAKGLEFTHVFLPAWESGVFPPDYGCPSEERRLAYVAITRGMRRVTVSHCGFRRGYAEPSPFLADIPERNRVAGWLRGPSLPARRSRPMLDVVEARELLRRF